MFRCKSITLALAAGLAAAGCMHAAVQPGPGSDERPSPGRIYQGQVRYGEATETYRQAVAAEPGSVQARNALGVTYAMQGRHGEAIEQFLAALALAPDQPYLHNNLGYAYLVAGENERAVEVLERGQRLDPSDRRIAANLAAARGRMAAAASSAASPETSPPVVASAAAIVSLASGVYELRLPAPMPAAAEPAVAPSLYRLEIANGNGVRGMARRAAGLLQGQGFAPARLTNRKPFDEARSRIEYRPGYRSQAVSVAGALPRNVETVEGLGSSGRADVRLVLGRDLVRPLLAATPVDGARIAHGEGRESSG